MKYSIIIPHRNIPHLLFRCYNSIPNSEDIEIIIVDDSSDEQTKLLVSDFFKDKNVRLIFDETRKGAGHARNVGLKNATGKWVLFADADDFFVENAFEIFDDYCDSDYDLIYFNTKTVKSDTLEDVENRHAYLDNWIRNNDLDCLRFRSAVPWAKMIRSSLIKENNILFDEIPVANDVWFSSQIGYFSKAVKAEKRIAYCSTIRSGSLYYKVTKERRIIRFMENIKVNSFLYKNGLRKYREEPLGYFWPVLYKPWDLLPIKYLLKYMEVEGRWQTFLNVIHYIKHKIDIKAQKDDKSKKIFK